MFLKRDKIFSQKEEAVNSATDKNNTELVLLNPTKEDGANEDVEKLRQRTVTLFQQNSEMSAQVMEAQRAKRAAEQRLAELEAESLRQLTAARTAARTTDLLGLLSIGSPRWEDSWEDSWEDNSSHHRPPGPTDHRLAAREDLPRVGALARLGASAAKCCDWDSLVDKARFA